MCKYSKLFGPPSSTTIEVKVQVLVAQLCLTLCDPMDCSLPGISVHGILQARILEWVAIPFSRGSSQTRDQTQVFCIAGIFFTVWTSREAHHNCYHPKGVRDIHIPKTSVCDSNFCHNDNSWEQCFSKYNTYGNCQYLPKMQIFVLFEMGPRFCISNNLPGGTADSQSTLSVAKV